MKKILCLALILCTFLVGCTLSGGGGEDTKSLVPPTQGTNAGESGTPGTSGEESSSPSPSEIAEIETQVLYEKDNFKITATGLELGSLWGSGVKLLLENGSDKTVRFSCQYVVVNNYMISDLLFSAEVAAGKKSNETLYFSNFDESGITKIGCIELYLRIIDSESYDEIAATGRLEIKTNLYDAMDGATADGTEIFNKEGVRVVAKYLSESTIWGKSVVLYIENNSDKDLRIDVEDLSVNDFSFSNLDMFTVLAGKKSVDAITLFDSELEKNNIDTVEKVEFKLEFMEPESYHALFASDVLTVQVQ